MRHSRILFIFIALAEMFRPCACHAADWPAFRGNCARTGFFPGEAGYPSSAPVWRALLGAEIVSSPAVVGNVLYIGARDSCIHAIDCGTGAILWKVKTKGWVDGSPLVDDNRVVV